MTDEPKSEDTGPVKPQVIDLDAEEVDVVPNDSGAQADAGEQEVPHDVDAEAAASGEMTPDADVEDVAIDDAPPPPPAKKSRSTLTWIAAAVILGLLAGGWFYRSVLAAYLPTDEMSAMASRIEILEAHEKTFGEQLLTVNQSSEAASKAVTGLETALKTTASGLSDAQTRIQTFETRIATAEETLTSARSDLEALRNAVSSVGTGTGSVDSAALEAIGQRIEALEKDVASLKSGSGGGDTAKATAALSQALADLKAKIAAGVAFQTEYDRLARMVPAAAGLDILAAHAAMGLPTPEGLAGELSAMIATLPKPETQAPPGDDSYWDTIWNNLSGIITIRNIGETDWPALAEKSASFAQAGDLTQAIAVIDAAEGAKPVGLSQWRDRAAARLNLEAAMGQVAEAVLRQIAALGGAQ